jgi:glycosyltransferase involved in cell wall biosynthesis
VIDGIIPVANDLFNKIPRWTKMIRPCRVIHNAIVIEDYKKENHREQIRRKHGIEADDLVLGVIGRMNPEKGCFEAIDSLTHLREMGIHPRLMMIGDGPLKEDLLGYSNKRGVAEQMVFTGHVNPVGPYYAAVDIVVSPSYTEGISNVILEAMACKIPVIATAVGGTPEIITHGVNGLLINPGNAKDISEAVSAIVNNPETTQRMTQAGFTTILENFEFGRRMRKVEKFYEIVLATH